MTTLINVTATASLSLVTAVEFERQHVSQTDVELSGSVCIFGG